METPYTDFQMSPIFMRTIFSTKSNTSEVAAAKNEENAVNEVKEAVRVGRKRRRKRRRRKRKRKRRNQNLPLLKNLLLKRKHLRRFSKCAVPHPAVVSTVNYKNFRMSTTDVWRCSLRIATAVRSHVVVHHAVGAWIWSVDVVSLNF